MAGCARRTLKVYFDPYFDGPDGSLGAAGFLQTSGELLNFHPHVHVLISIESRAITYTPFISIASESNFEALAEPAILIGAGHDGQELAIIRQAVGDAARCILLWNLAVKNRFAL